MGKRIAAWSLLTCCALASAASGLTADDYVIAGRARLFAGTAAGLIEACDIFEAGLSDTDCPDCPTDRELVLFGAVARTAMLFVDHNDVLVRDGLFRLAEEFGVPVLAIVPRDDGGDSPDDGWTDSLWTRAADGEMTRDVLQNSVLPEIEGIIRQLDSIDDSSGTFVVYLAPAETGLADDLEVDYGDVLIFKGLLLAYKGLLVAEMVQNPDGWRLCEGEAPGTGDQRSSLLAALTVAEDDASDNERLAVARADCVEALTCYVDGVESIAAEDYPVGSDPQHDELVYVDAEAYVRLDVYREALAALRGHLADGGGCVRVDKTTETYDVYDSNSMRLGRLSLVFDCMGTEGQGGRLVLDDGIPLEVDWFAVFEEGEIGVSLFGQGQKREAWLEGTIDADRRVVRLATLESWGAAPDEEEEQGVQIPPLAETTVNWWRHLWSEQVQSLVTTSHSWFAWVQPTDPPSLN